MTPGYEADMRRIIGRDVTCRTYARGVIVSLPCTGGHTVEHQMEKMLPPDALKRQLANRGWKLGKRLTCPDHTRREKPAMPEATQPAVVTPAAGMTPDARKVHRAVMEALMSVYDDDGKRYTGGYTDTKVAEETGAAVEYVRKTREEFFGPVAIPPEFTALRGELDRARVANPAREEGRRFGRAEGNDPLPRPMRGRAERAGRAADREALQRNAIERQRRHPLGRSFAPASVASGAAWAVCPG